MVSEEKTKTSWSYIHLLFTRRKQALVLPIPMSNRTNFFPPDLAQSLIDLIETTRCSGSSWRHNLTNSIIDLSKRIRMCTGSEIRESLFRDDFELKKKKRPSAHIIEMSRDWHHLIHLLR